MTIFNPWLWLGILASIVLAYGGGRAQQWHRDEVNWEKQKAQMAAAAQAEKERIEGERVKEREAAEAEAKKRDAQRSQQLLQARQRIAELDALVAARPAPLVGGLLNDANDAASGASAAPAKPRNDPATAAQGRDTTIGQWASWSVEVIGLYYACRDQVIGLVNFYNKQRAIK